MWRALLISLVAHFCIMYLIPSIQILPSGTEYIEIESIWLEESEGEITQEEGVGEEPFETSESIQPEQSQVEAPVPTNLDAVEPEMVKDDRYAGEDESAIDPWLSEDPQRLAQMSQFQSPMLPPKVLPGDAVKELVPEIPRKIPEPETLETAPVKPETQPPPEELPSPILPEEVPSVPPQIPDEPQVLEIPSFVLSEILEDPQEPQLLTRLQRSVQSTSLLAPAEFTPILKEEREPLFVPSSDMSENPEKPEAELSVNLEDFLSIKEESQKVETIEPEELPIIEISELAQISQHREQGELSIASYSRRSPVSRQTESVSRPFSQSFKTKVAPDSTPPSNDENLIHREESSLAEAATELSFPQRKPVEQKPLVQQSLDEPRELQAAQDIFMNISSQPEIPHRFQPPQAPDVKRSFVIGGKTEEQVFVADRSSLGIVVRKESVLQQEEVPDAVLEPEDLDRASLDEDRGASAFDIEGPAAQRQVLYKPRQFPEIQLDTEVNIRLKFWVLPDGSVGEVFPLQRGDIRLERAAIEYLRSWRFTPVAPNQPRVWGIIPITYKLQ